MIRTATLLLITLSFFAFNSSFAQDAQWRGPNRDGIFKGENLLKEWPESGPEKLFVAEGLGKSYSSAVATESMIYVTGIKDSLEYLSALDFKGNIVWQKPFGRCWTNTFPESRCTPTVEDDRVYVLTGLDLMTCFNSENGEKIWEVDLHEQYSSSWDMFGVSESPLIVDNKVIASPCGDQTTVIALDKFTGELIWKSESLKALRSNMSPIAINHMEGEYIVSSTQTHMIGVDSDNGEILWTYQYNFLDDQGQNSTIFTNTPVYRDSCLWISNGWDVKSVKLEISSDGKSVSERYTDRTFDNQNHGVVLIDKYVYGSNFTGRQSGKWVCMNWDTGEIVWIEDFHNKGPILAAEGMLYIMEEKRGNMALVKADPKEFKIISTFKVEDGSGPYWARPSIYYGMLLVRHGDVLIGYDIQGE